MERSEIRDCCPEFRFASMRATGPAGAAAVTPSIVLDQCDNSRAPYSVYMRSQITNVIPIESAAAGKVTAPAVLNRAAWPTGSLLARVIVTQRISYAASCSQIGDTVPDAASNAA